MSITKRISRLLRADIHGILDSLEDPESVLKQALRDMEETVRADEEEIKRASQSLEVVGRRCEALEKGIAESGEKVSLAVRSGNDELARTLLRRKLEDERCAEKLRREREAKAQALIASRTRAAERRDELERIRVKADLFVRESAAEQRAAEDISRRHIVSDAEVELALMEAKLQAQGKQAEGERV